MDTATIQAITEATENGALTWTVRGRRYHAQPSSTAGPTVSAYRHLHVHETSGATVILSGITHPEGAREEARKILGFTPRAAAIHHLVQAITRKAVHP